MGITRKYNSRLGIYMYAAQCLLACSTMYIHVGLLAGIGMISPALGTVCERQTYSIYKPTYTGTIHSSHLGSPKLFLLTVLHLSGHIQVSQHLWVARSKGRPGAPNWPLLMQTVVTNYKSRYPAHSPVSAVFDFWVEPHNFHPPHTPALPRSQPLAPCITKPNPGRELLSSSQYENQCKTFREEKCI